MSYSGAVMTLTRDVPTEGTDRVRHIGVVALAPRTAVAH